MKAGHTLALAGDYREDVSTTTRGIPWLMDSPVIGPMFRSTTEEKNETELVFLLTPRFVSEVEASRVPRLGPGQLTGSPSDRELYLNGHVEVPRCNEDCPVNNGFSDAPSQGQPRQGTVIGQAQPIQLQNLTNSYYQQAPQVKPQFESSYRFPQNGSPQAKSKPAQRQANKGGFLWPTNPKRR